MTLGVRGALADQKIKMGKKKKGPGLLLLLVGFYYYYITRNH